MKAQIDSYAAMAGLSGIAHSADGMVELAVRLRREVRVTPVCCSIALGDEVLALDRAEGMRVDLQDLMQRERCPCVTPSFGRHQNSSQLI